jgi:acyl carrier protein
LVLILSNVDLLIATISSDAKAEEKIEAIKSIGYSKNIRALESLVGLLEDANAEVRSAVIWAIGKYKSKDKLPLIIPKIKDPDESVRTVALKTLAKFTSNPEILNEILKLLDDSDPKVRKMVLETIDEFDSNTTNNILDIIVAQLAKDDDKDVKLKAIELIGGYLFKDSKASKALISSLENATEFEIQMAVIDHLAKIDPYVKEFLMLALKGRKKIFVEDILPRESSVDLIYRRNSPLVMKVRSFKEEIEQLKKYIDFLVERNQLITSS